MANTKGKDEIRNKEKIEKNSIREEIWEQTCTPIGLSNIRKVTINEVVGALNENGIKEPKLKIVKDSKLEMIKGYILDLKREIQVFTDKINNEIILDINGIRLLIIGYTSHSLGYEGEVKKTILIVPISPRA